MGNRLCKKKVADSAATEQKPNSFDRIINRLHLRPTAWKSDSQLNEKQLNRGDEMRRKSQNGVVQHARPLSNAKSSDWTEASLEVPEKEDVVHLKNPQLSLIFNDNTTPTPPPRKNKKTLREKLESVAKNGLQALQTKKVVPLSKEEPQESPKPVEEAPFVKKTITYGCPLDDHDHAHHNRDHKRTATDADDETSRLNKNVKRKKNLSVVSLPNINELKFSVAKAENLKRTDSGNNLVETLSTKPKETASTGKLESYMIRCRSIGSLFPQKTKHKKSKVLNDAESDDSFGGLEDWDCKILEYYKPKDTSLQRLKKPPNDEKTLSEVEKLIVPQEDFEKENQPVRPIRRSESVDKSVSSKRASVEQTNNPGVNECKISKNIEEPVQKRSDNKLVSENYSDVKVRENKPASPNAIIKRESTISISKLPVKDEQGNVEHSALIKILHEYSKKEAEERKIQQNEGDSTKVKESETNTQELEKKRSIHEEEDHCQPESNLSSISMTPSLIEFEKAMLADPSVVVSIENFLDAERRDNVLVAS